ncbi:MAG TPA: class I SAM-dependent methyltransferase [Thermoanaerobaculia bacterium]|nr:class I SAM-dependent methyltransferase [Thermoanaerobaculia bacterium]
MAERSAVQSPSRDLEPHLRGFPSHLFNRTFYESCELIDRYTTAWAIELAGRLGLTRDIAADRAASDIRSQRGFAASFTPALSWVIERLKERPAGPAREVNRQELLQALLELDPENKRSTDLIDAAGDSYPAVANGALRGEEALFGPARAALWWRYFDNANPFYAINNRIAALVAARHLPAEGPIRILEVGSGTGSGTRALLEILADQGLDARLSRYVASEPAAFFRRRAERSLKADYRELEIAFTSLDIDLPWEEQGIEPGTFDLIFAVNVLHVAQDLSFSLRQARRALVAGGWLVAGECVRPYAGTTVGIEMIFRLLSDFNRVRLDPDLRPEAGFLSPESWLAILASSGFAEITIAPDIRRIREIYPRFFTGALCARRSG